MSERTNFERTLLKMNRSKLVELMEDAILLYQAALDDGQSPEMATSEATSILLNSMEMKIELDEAGLLAKESPDV